MNETVLSLSNIHKTYGSGANRLEVLRGVNFSLHKGEMVALVGPSGSGKSTLLHLMGLLDQADRGEITVAGQVVPMQNDDQRTRLRCGAIGFVYQFHHLLPEFSALENVIVPQMIAGKGRRDAAKRAELLLTLVGLKERLGHRPAELSGGEQQRVAIARALANAPQILIADEPTGNLDIQNSNNVFNVLQDVCVKERVAVLMATHNQELARSLPRVITMCNGIVMEGQNHGSGLSQSSAG